MEKEIRPIEWVVLKIEYPSGVLYKVFCSLTGADWKINSGITKIEVIDNEYFFYGYSSSVYICKAKEYGIKGFYPQMFLAELIEIGEKITIIAKKEIENLEL